MRSLAKSRLVPLHQTMVDALRSFVKHRDRFFARCQPQIVPQWLFVSSDGNPMAIPAFPCEKSLSETEARHLRHEVELAAEEENAGAIIAEGAEAAGIGFELLDLAVEPLGHGVGDGVGKVVQ